MSVTLFENYESYLKENATDFSSPTSVSRLFRDDSAFNDFKDCLTETCADDTASEVAGRILDRQREFLLTEAANVGGSSFAHGWSVTSLPILVDIYAEPIISQVMNVYPVSTPVMSIPRVKIKASTIGYNGAESEAVTMPTAQKRVRANELTLTINSGVNNVFTLAAATDAANGLTKANAIMNRRYTVLSELAISGTNASETAADNAILVNLRPDARDTINSSVASFMYTAKDTKKYNIKVTMTINYDSGEVVFSPVVVAVDGGTDAANITVGGKLSLRFTAKSSDLGRTKVKIETSMTDVTIDPTEDVRLYLAA